MSRTSGDVRFEDVVTGRRIPTMLLTGLCLLVGMATGAVGQPACWLWVAGIVIVVLLLLFGGGLWAQSAGGNPLTPLWGTVYSLNVMMNVGLLVLVSRHEPLPVSDLPAAGRVLVIYCVACIAVVFVRYRMSLFSFPVMVLCATFAYTCSSFALLLYRGVQVFDNWKAFYEESVLVGVPVVMLAFSSFVTGSLAVGLRCTGSMVRPRTRVLHEPSGSALALLRVGLFLLWSSIITLGLLTLRGGGLTAAITEGYGSFTDIHKLGQREILTTASLSFGIPWAIVIVASVIGGQNALRKLAVLIGIGVLIMVIAGDRTGPLSVLLTVSGIMHVRGFRMGWRRTATMVAALSVLLVLVPGIRRVPLKEWNPQTLVKALSGELQESRLDRRGAVDSVLLATSNSYQTLMGTVMLVPDEEPYRLGKDYVLAAATGFPFGSRILNAVAPDLLDEKPSSWMTSKLSRDTRPTRTGLAYLQVAEAYLQFSGIGVLLVFLLLGYWLSRLWLLMLKGEMKDAAFSFCALLVQASLIWVRNDVYLMGRTLIWCGFLVFVVPAALRTCAGRGRLRECENA